MKKFFMATMFIIMALIVISCKNEKKGNGNAFLPFLFSSISPTDPIDPTDPTNYTGPIAFNFTGGKALGVVDTVTGPSGSISTFYSDTMSFIKGDYPRNAITDENEEKFLVKIMEDDSIQNAISLPDGYTLPAITSLVRSPIDGSIFISFQSPVEYTYTDEVGNSINVNLGTILHVKPDNTYTALFPDENPLYIDITILRNGLKAPFDFDENGFVYFACQRPSEDNMTYSSILYRYDPATGEKSVIISADSNVRINKFQVDPTGTRLLVLYLQGEFPEGEVSRLVMYPVNNINNPLVIFDGSPVVVDGFPIENELTGFNFSPAGSYMLVTLRTSTPFLFRGIAKIDIVSDGEVSYHPLFMAHQGSNVVSGTSQSYWYYYFPGDTWTPFEYYNAIYVLTTDGTQFSYATGNIKYMYDSTGLVGGEVGFALDINDPSQKSGEDIDTLRQFVDSGGTPLYYYQKPYFSNGEIIYEFEEITRTDIVDLMFSSGEWAYNWKDAYFINGTYTSGQLNVPLLLDYFGSYYTEEIEYKWGSDTNEAAFAQALNNAPYSFNDFFNAAQSDADNWDPYFFLKNHIFKPGTSDNPKMIHEMLAETGYFPTEGNMMNFFDMVNTTNFIFNEQGEAFGLLNTVAVCSEGTCATPKTIPVKLLDADAKKDMRLVEQFLDTDFNPVQFLIKNNHLYFLHFPTDGTSSKLYRFNLTDPANVVEDMLVNCPESGTLSITSWSVGDTSLYFTGTLDGTSINAIVSLDNYEYTELEDNMSLSQITAY